MAGPTDEWLAEQGFHTEKEREAVRQLIAILEPLPPQRRQHTVRLFAAREDGEAKFREIFGNK
jgi:hypothetical protein